MNEMIIILVGYFSYTPFYMIDIHMLMKEWDSYTEILRRSFYKEEEQ